MVWVESLLTTYANKLDNLDKRDKLHKWKKLLKLTQEEVQHLNKIEPSIYIHH